MNFNQWAARWAIPPEAIAELADLTGTQFESTTKPALSEAAVQNNVRLAASREGIRLFRNNLGQYLDDRGKPVRYGLANDNKKLNSKIKSSDLIGIKPVVVTPEMVGLTVGIFMARECKAAGWSYKGNKHEEAQLAFINLINSLGGDASFTTGTL